jgi:uncharacterized membrane protein YqiK
MECVRGLCTVAPTLRKALAEQAIARGMATATDLERQAEGWREWGAADDGWFAVLHGEILARA